MLTHIHHINFLVKDLNVSQEYFSKLLQHEPVFEDLPKRGVRTARFQIGETIIVLVQPTSDTGPVADILKSRGEGVFLVSFATESVDQALQKLELQQLERRKGLQNWDICDISDVSQFGAILQLTSPQKP